MGLMALLHEKLELNDAPLVRQFQFYMVLNQCTIYKLKLIRLYKITVNDSTWLSYAVQPLEEDN